MSLAFIWRSSACIRIFLCSLWTGLGIASLKLSIAINLYHLPSHVIACHRYIEVFGWYKFVRVYGWAYIQKGLVSGRGAYIRGEFHVIFGGLISGLNKTFQMRRYYTYYIVRHNNNRKTRIEMPVMPT